MYFIGFIQIIELPLRSDMNKSFQKDNTMNFIIDSHIYAVSADGGDCLVHTEKGDFRHKGTWNREPEKSENDYPQYSPNISYLKLSSSYL